MAADQLSLWTVDRLAASNLVADLALELSDGQIERIARHFSEHRISMSGWAAERLHTRLVEALEAASQTLFVDHDEAWSRGFSHAEQVVLTAGLAQMLNLEPARERSKGQILRAMIHQPRPR